MATPQPASAETAAELTVRPKVLRRPAQFSPGNKPALMQAAPALLISESKSEPATPAAKAWQDDGRFAITLITIVILMNIAVTFWLAVIEYHATDAPSIRAKATDIIEAPSDPIHLLDGLAPESTEQ